MVALFACGVAVGFLATLFLISLADATTAGEQDRPTLYDQDTDQ